MKNAHAGFWIIVVLAFACLSASAAAADDCPTSKDEIATDRPDVTNRASSCRQAVSKVRMASI